MSQPLTAFLINAFVANADIIDKVGKDSAGNLAVWPYHYRDTDAEVPFPHVTVSRFGSTTEEGKFQEDPIYETKMDNPRIAVCVWGRNSVDENYAVYNVLDAMMRGQAATQIADSTFGIYRIKRTNLRDDLWDDNQAAYHLHSEYSCWLQLTSAPQP